SGVTTISNGGLQLISQATIPNSRFDIKGGKLDVSSITGYSFASQPVNVIGGTLFVSTATANSTSVNFTNGTLQFANLASASLSVNTINLGGSTNAIQPLGIPAIAAYPISYSVV